MEDKLRRYVDELFKGANSTKTTVELKEEMIQNLQDKYRDLLSEGKTPDEAFNIVISGIGDVSVLLDELGRDVVPVADETGRHKSAMLMAIAAMMYIISIVPFIIFDRIIGPVITILIIAVATGILIYNFMTAPKYYKESDTMKETGTIVEEFRRRRARRYRHRSTRRFISVIMWPIIVALYLMISFSTSAWHITWIIFIIGALAESAIRIFFLSENR